MDRFNDDGETVGRAELLRVDRSGVIVGHHCLEHVRARHLSHCRRPGDHAIRINDCIYRCQGQAVGQGVRRNVRVGRRVRNSQHRQTGDRPVNLRGKDGRAIYFIDDDAEEVGCA